MVSDGLRWFAMVSGESRPTIRIRLGMAMDRPDPTWSGHGPIRIRICTGLDRIWTGLDRIWTGLDRIWNGFGADLIGLDRLVSDLDRIGSDLDWI